MHLFRIMQTKKLFLLLIISIFCLIVTISIFRSSPINDLDRNYRLKKIDQLIKSQASTFACKQPELPVNSPEMMKFVHEVNPLSCWKSEPNWVKCEGSECTIQENQKIIYGPILCGFTDVIRVNDFDLTDGETVLTDSYFKLETSDVVKVNCKSETKKWSNALTGIRLDKQIWDRTGWDDLPEKALKMNVLMFGFDSISRNTFKRKLPKSYEYLTKVLNGLILQGYNIVGDGTPQALIPILTGNTELELPDTRKRVPNSQFVNSYPFIWNDFKNAGYVTGFFEDVPQLGTFTYRLNGFKDSPTDHYMRTYYLSAAKYRSGWETFCSGDTPNHQIMFNQIKNFFSVYKSKPKFLFGFHGELSHDDYNLIGVADDDLKQFLIDMHESGALNNTILILMADHGHRFAEIRNTVQGKQEERLPFFSFTFPPWFKNRHQQAYVNFKSNLNKLTTPFDIYTTLKSVLNLEDIGLADISRRSVSLFSKIPVGRSCVDAYIEPHWCACLEWINIPLSSPIVNRIADKLVTTLNNFTQSNRNLCEILKVSTIKSVARLSPNDNLIKYHKNADIDGFVADLSAKINVTTDKYQIKAILVPGLSIFEASMTYYIKDDKFVLKMSDISRINKYGLQAKCVEDHLPHLRKYCYCKNY